MGRAAWTSAGVSTERRAGVGVGEARSAYWAGAQVSTQAGFTPARGPGGCMRLEALGPLWGGGATWPEWVGPT